MPRLLHARPDAWQITPSDTSYMQTAIMRVSLTCFDVRKVAGIEYCSRLSVKFGETGDWVPSDESTPENMNVALSASPRSSERCAETADVLIECKEDHAAHLIETLRVRPLE